MISLSEINPTQHSLRLSIMNNDEESHGNHILIIPQVPDKTAFQVVNEACHGDKVSIGACCQVEIHVRPNNPTSLLYSRDCDGCRKRTGGDEFYIRYEEYMADNGDSLDEYQNLHLQAVAFVSDHGDGSYDLDFCTTPMHPSLPKQHDTTNCITKLTSIWTVYIEYTNGIGSLPPPKKRDWQNGAYTHKMYQISTKGPSTARPWVREFKPPKPEILLSDFDQVFLFGDSTFCQFVRQRPNKKGKYYFQSNLRVLGEKVRVGLDSTSVSTLLVQLEESNIKSVLSQNITDKQRALIVGSCLWDTLNWEDDLQSSLYQDHAEACRTYIDKLRQTYPDLIIVWKSPMACHIHWVDLKRVVEHDRATATLFGLNRIRYMSASRSRYLYELQKKICFELKIPFLDLYEATYLSADLLYPSDGRHYKPDLNRKMLGWFYDELPGEEEERSKYYQEVSIENKAAMIC
jgi:hypothetical protein